MKKRLYYKADPRESEEMSLNEQIFANAVEDPRLRDGVDEGAYAEDKQEEEEE